MTITALYEASAHATGGRDGHVATLDGGLDLKPIRAKAHFPATRL
jgi:organic hydroperoxide reductase OsmC/OhrA